MEDIKFRVWEPLNQKMHYLDFALYQFSSGRNSHKFVLPPNRQNLQNPYSVMNLESVKVMRYTGLKGLNDIEIFEGDICNFGNLSESPFVVQHIREKSALCLVCKETKQQFLFEDFHYHELVVIGNIYEHDGFFN